LGLEDLAAGAVKRLKVGLRLLDGGTEDKGLEITVHPGWKSGMKVAVRFPHAGNEQPGGGAAQRCLHARRERPQGKHQAPAHRLSKTLELLDGRKLQIPVPLGTVKPGQTMTIPGEGMPVRKDGQVQSKGGLIVTWEEEPHRVLAA
ncbi:hypothetical protein HYPSUDRAFT_151552, partial [Hypholoma sublateritium FD-334 SS-4]